MAKSVKVSEETYNRLCSEGLYKETFDEIISRLLDVNALAKKRRTRHDKGKLERAETDRPT